MRVSPIGRGFEDVWHKHWAASAAAALALALTAVGWFAATTLVERQAHERFDSRTHQIQEAVVGRLESYVQVLRAGASLFDATEHVTRDMWRTYVDGLRLSETYPGFQGVGYTARITAERLERHEQVVREQGFPDYRVHPRAERAEYHSIVYLEPFDWRNQRAFGFDMFTEPVRRAAMERARDTGQPAMSGQVVLVQETEEDVQAGFLIYYPVYRPGIELDTPAARRDALLGFVYSPVRMDNLLRGVLGSLRHGIDFEVYDGIQPAAANRMYSSLEAAGDARSTNSRFVGVRTLEVAGHRWTLYFSSAPEFEALTDRWYPWLVLAAGLVVSGLLFGMVRASTARRSSELASAEALRALNAKLEARVAERTRQLETANRELEAFAYSVSHDLRAPLRAISGYSERLTADDGNRLSSESAHYLTRIRAGVARMRQLIDDLLALSRVSRLQLRRTEVDLSALARGIIADLRAGEPARDVEVTIDETPSANADPRLMQIVLENLIGNAWKFTARRERPRIQFGSRDDDGQATYFVRDNGAGFDTARAGRLFEPFQRLHLDSEFPGSGIGLATVARIIGRHGGRLRADAEMDRGATIFFTVGA